MNHTKGQKGKQTNNPPERQCMSCREKHVKADLFRIVRTDEGVIYDPTGRKNGRGAYVCARKECVEKAVRTGALARSLKTDIPSDLYDTLLALVKE